MISIDLWRARIGLFNNKRPRGRSGFRSSFFFASFHNCHRKNVRTQDSTYTVDSFSSSSSSVLVAEERPTTDDRSSHHTCTSTVSFDSQRNHSSSSTAATTSSFSSTAGGGLFSLRRSLLGDVLIILLIAIISQQLIMSGDIETNPGPRLGGEYTHVLVVIWLSCVALYPHLS